MSKSSNYLPCLTPIRYFVKYSPLLVKTSKPQAHFNMLYFQQLGFRPVGLSMVSGFRFQVSGSGQLRPARRQLRLADGYLLKHVDDLKKKRSYDRFFILVTLIVFTAGLKKQK